MPYENTTENVSVINEPLQPKHNFQTWMISWECNSSNTWSYRNAFMGFLKEQSGGTP